MIKIGINGFGRIGRIAFRIASKRSDIEIVGINDLLDIDHLAYLLKYDSVHGKYDGTVEVVDGKLVVDGNTIHVSAERDPEKLQWGVIGADFIIDCTGIFTTMEAANKHIIAVLKK